MRHRLPSAIASAIQTARDQHAAGHIPDIPFQPAQASLLGGPASWRDWLAEIGRASCRERVWIPV